MDGYKYYMQLSKQARALKDYALADAWERQAQNYKKD